MIPWDEKAMLPAMLPRQSLQWSSFRIQSLRRWQTEQQILGGVVNVLRLDTGSPAPRAGAEARDHHQQPGLQQPQRLQQA
jgi:hypothetical protein